MSVALHKATRDKDVLLSDISDIARNGAAIDDSASDYDDGLLAVAGPIMVLCYVLLFTIAAFTFAGTGNALFVVVISAFFAVIYFAIPLLMLRIRSQRDARWSKERARATAPEVDVWTGPMHRKDAIIQIVLIPLAVLMGFALLCFRWSML